MYFFFLLVAREATRRGGVRILLGGGQGWGCTIQPSPLWPEFSLAEVPGAHHIGWRSPRKVWTDMDIFIDRGCSYIAGAMQPIFSQTQTAAVDSTRRLKKKASWGPSWNAIRACPGVFSCLFFPGKCKYICTTVRSAKCRLPFWESQGRTSLVLWSQVVRGWLSRRRWVRLR